MVAENDSEAELMELLQRMACFVMQKVVVGPSAETNGAHGVLVAACYGAGYLRSN